MPPVTSSEELAAFAQALGLEVELADTDADLDDDDFEVLVAALLDWYDEPKRAHAAKVYALRKGHEASGALRDVLERWVGALPATLDGERVVAWAADALFIRAAHSSNESDAPALLALEGAAGSLLLLRPESSRRPMFDEGLFPASLTSPDTEAAVRGIFRSAGCTQAFADHVASGCAPCRAALEAWDREHGLPSGFAQLKR